MLHFGFDFMVVYYFANVGLPFWFTLLNGCKKGEILSVENDEHVYQVFWNYECEIAVFDIV